MVNIGGVTQRSLFSARFIIVIKAVAIFVVELTGSMGATEPEFLVDTWQTEDGLPQNTIRCITQTRDGYLWLGTFDGLVRFDGIHFEVFTPNNDPGLPSGRILSLFEDRQGRLWIGTDGEGVVYLERGVFQQLQITSDGERLQRVYQITQLPNGVMFFSTSTRAFQLIDGKTEPFGPELGLAPMEMYATPTEAGNGTYWLAAGLNLYHVSNGKAELRYTSSSQYLTRTPAPAGGVFCGLEDGRFIEVSIRAEPRITDFENALFTAVQHTRSRDLWLATHDGLFFQRDTNRLHLTTTEGLSAREIASVFEDREGNLWVGTNGGGLQRLREKQVRIHSADSGLNSNDTISLLQDREHRIWVGTFRGGVSVYSDGNWNPFELPIEPPLNPNIASLCQTRDGRIWMGGFECANFLWSNDLLTETELLDGDGIRVLYEDGTSGLWIGSNTNGVAFRRGTMEIRYDTSNGLSRNQITAISQDISGATWIATRHGLNKIAGDKVRAFFQKDGLGADGIYSLWHDADDTLWIGTMGGGLSRFKNGEFATITRKRGLLSDVIGQVIGDDMGNLWMGTTTGIMRVNKKSLNDALDGKLDFVACQLFGKNEGLDQSECAGGFQPACMKARDGTLWFCTVGGVVSIDPRKFSRNEIPPPVHIERVIIDEKEVVPVPASTRERMFNTENVDTNPGGTPHVRALKPITVPAGTARIELQYTGLCLIAPERVHFSFLLEGYDTDWSRSDTRRSAVYTHVPPGNYQFRVRAANNDGIWNEAGAAVSLRIQAHYWQTMWFRFVIGTTVFALFVGSLWVRHQYLKRIESLRVRIANELHDEAGSNLGSIRLLSRRMAKRLKDQPSVAPEVAEIERISAETADYIRTSVWLIDPQFDTLEQMLKAMEGFAARLFSDASYHCEWNVVNPNRQLPLEFRRHFFLMFKEILHNVQKHAQADRVEIQFTENQGHVLLRVEDNGLGFEPERTHEGHGLSSLRNRAAQLSGKLEIESQAGQGTTITLRV